MSCTHCNQEETTSYHRCKPQPCQEVNDCDCPINIQSKCVTYSGENLECSGIVNGTNLDELIQQLDAFICQKVDDITNALTLINVGNGEQVYKGIDLLGRKEIRTLTSTNDIVEITTNANEIEFDINDEELETFIHDNQLTVVLENVGDGAEILKTPVVVDNETTYEVKSLIVESQGGGESLVRDTVSPFIQENTDDLTLRLKSLKSDTLTITSTDEEISIEQPITASIPALYVNDLYEPTYQEWVNAGGDLTSNPTFEYVGEGTLGKPFTNSINYTSTVAFTITPNSAIQNALDAYVGDTGTYSRLNPELIGQKIIIQYNDTGYTFSGDFNYMGLNVELQGNVLSTITGYLIDMDDIAAFDPDIAQVTINIGEGVFLQIQGDGLNNSGNTEAGTTYATGRQIVLLGDGTLYSATNDITKYILNADVLDSGNNNDGGTCFFVGCKIRADYQGIYRIGGNARIDFFSELTSGLLTTPVDLSLKAFYQTGGQVRHFKGSEVKIFGTTRDAAIVFEPSLGFTPIYISQNCTYSGVATNLFEKLNTDNVDLQVTNSISGYSLIVTEVFESPDLWQVYFTQNVLASGNIDITKADLTLGNTSAAINTIGSNIIESLRTFVSKNSARLSLLPKYTAYIVERDVNADDLIAGTEYKIKTAGSPSLGTVGDYFISTGTETGTGVATLIERNIMI